MRDMAFSNVFSHKRITNWRMVLNVGTMHWSIVQQVPWSHAAIIASSCVSDIKSRIGVWSSIEFRICLVCIRHDFFFGSSPPSWSSRGWIQCSTFGSIIYSVGGRQPTTSHVLGALDRQEILFFALRFGVGRNLIQDPTIGRKMKFPICLVDTKSDISLSVLDQSCRG